VDIVAAATRRALGVSHVQRTGPKAHPAYHRRKVSDAFAHGEHGIYHLAVVNAEVGNGWVLLRFGEIRQRLIKPAGASSFKPGVLTLYPPGKY